MAGKIPLALDVGDKFVRVAQVSDGGQHSLIETADGAGFPSEFWYNGTQALFGAAAIGEREKNPRSIVRQLSVLLEESLDRRVQPGDPGDASVLLGVLIRRFVWRPTLACLLAADAVKTYGGGLDIAVVVPPDMTEQARRNLRRGLRLGGMNVRLFVEEWKALAQNYGGEESLDGVSLVVDLGRSLKLSLLEPSDDRRLRLLGYRRYLAAGGAELESQVRASVLNRLQEKLNRDYPRWAAAWKQEFGVALERGIRDLMAGEKRPPVVSAGGASVELSVDPMESASESQDTVDLYFPILSRASDISSRVARFLEEMNVPAARVNRLLFCGGAADFPLLVDILKEQVYSFQKTKDTGMPMRDLLVLGAAEYAVVHQFDDDGSAREALAEANDVTYIDGIGCGGGEWPGPLPEADGGRAVEWIAPMERRKLPLDARHLEVRLESDCTDHLIALVAMDDDERSWVELGRDAQVLPEAEQLSDGSIHVFLNRRGGRAVEFLVESASWPREPHFRVLVNDSQRGTSLAEVSQEKARVESRDGRVTLLRLYFKDGCWRVHNPLTPIPEAVRPVVTPRPISAPILDRARASKPAGRTPVLTGERLPLGESGIRTIRATKNGTGVELESVSPSPGAPGQVPWPEGLIRKADWRLDVDLAALKEDLVILLPAVGALMKSDSIEVTFDGEDGQYVFGRGAASGQKGLLPRVVLQRSKKRWNLRIEEEPLPPGKAREAPKVPKAPTQNPPPLPPALPAGTVATPNEGWSVRSVDEQEKLVGDGADLLPEEKHDLPPNSGGRVRVRLVGYEQVAWRTWLIVKRRDAKEEAFSVGAARGVKAALLEIALDLGTMNATEARIIVEGWKDTLKGVTVYAGEGRIGRFKMSAFRSDVESCAVLRFYLREGRGWRFERLLERECVKT